MTDEEFLTWLQDIIGYVFRNKNLLQTTLISPGFEGSKVGSKEEVKRYEGNRTAAQLGDSLIPLVVRHQVLLVEGASRDSANNASTTINGRKYQEDRAEFLNIKAHLKLNKRQKGRVDPTTSRLALCAIIGAVWLDCGQDFAITMQVVQRLLFGPKLSPCIDPEALSTGKEVVSTPEFFDEWLHDYRSPSEGASCSSLNVSIEKLAASQSDPQIVSDDGPSNSITYAETGNMNGIIQRNQRTIKSGRVHGTTNSNLELRSKLAPVVTEPSPRMEPILNECSHMEPMQASPEAVSIPTLPTRKRQFSIDRAVGQTSILDHLNDYTRLENERCQNLGVAFSPDDFDKAMEAAHRFEER
ncbi:uncharacterized protein RSE6_14220 [Rhynchosporium secalis]|uniref:RNase III domain-containing protein n=1 Tax=Rhynchosporium secalis TaxID=38038 RepID=A0A1E1MUW0_RHYSE|nr:uncharacterized protein RSE6_14220 [Rhynchosporium secalis]